MPKCSGTSVVTGEPCGNNAVLGGTVCRFHGGGGPGYRQKAQLRYEVSRWQPGDTTEDPGEVLLRLVTQSMRRCTMYAALLEQLYDHCDLLGADSEVEGLPASVQALIGGTYSATPNGRVYQTGEQIRGLVQLEMAERKLCADFATKAVAAGLAERQVRMAERQGQAVIEAITVALDAAGLTGDARMRAQNAAADKLLELTA